MKYFRRYFKNLAMVYLPLFMGFKLIGACDYLAVVLALAGFMTGMFVDEYVELRDFLANPRKEDL